MTLSATCSVLALSSGDTSSLAMALIAKTHGAGHMPMKKGRSCARTGCRSSGRAYQGFQSKDPELERIIEGDALHSRAAAGRSKEYPEEKSAAFDCRS